MRRLRFAFVSWWLHRPRQQSKIRAAFDQHVLEAMEIVGPTSVEPTSHTRAQLTVEAALAQVPVDRRKVLVVHPAIPDLPLIKCEAAKLGLHVVKGDSRLIKPGEAYLISNTEWIKKESWE